MRNKKFYWQLTVLVNFEFDELHLMISMPVSALSQNQAHKIRQLIVILYTHMQDSAQFDFRASPGLAPMFR